MLFKKERKRRRGVSPFRLILSLVMFLVLIAGIYSAYKSFSGVDPLKVNPKSALNTIISSDRVYNLITGILAFSPKSIANTVSQNPVIKDNPAHQVYQTSSNSTANPTAKPTPRPKLLFKFAAVADSENDNQDLAKALAQAKQNGAQFIIGLGDYTQVGTVDELNSTKKEFDSSGLEYHLIPGDHDLWDSRNRSLPPTTDYSQVFGQNYSSFTHQNTHFLLVDNSDNYHGVDPDQMNFIQSDLASSGGSRLKFVFVSTPVYHPSSDHVMGDVEPSLKSQATSLISLFKRYNVNEVFGGDTHFYSDYTEPNSSIHMTAIGAITAYRNLQGPRYLLVDVYSDGSYNIQDTEVKQ